MIYFIEIVYQFPTIKGWDILLTPYINTNYKMQELPIL